MYNFGRQSPFSKYADDSCLQMNGDRMRWDQLSPDEVLYLLDIMTNAEVHRRFSLLSDAVAEYLQMRYSSRLSFVWGMYANGLWVRGRESLRRRLREMQIERIGTLTLLKFGPFGDAPDSSGLQKRDDSAQVDQAAWRSDYRLSDRFSWEMGTATNATLDPQRDEAADANG